MNSFFSYSVMEMQFFIVYRKNQLVYSLYVLYNIYIVDIPLWVHKL